MLCLHTYSCREGKMYLAFVHFKGMSKRAGGGDATVTRGPCRRLLVENDRGNQEQPVRSWSKQIGQTVAKLWPFKVLHDFSLVLSLTMSSAGAYSMPRRRLLAKFLTSLCTCCTCTWCFFLYFMSQHLDGAQCDVVSLSAFENSVFHQAFQNCWKSYLTPFWNRK